MPARWTYYQGSWIEDTITVLGPQNHAIVQSSIVFDGARSIRGCSPDLPLHCERLVKSAVNMLLAPKQNADEICELCIEGVKKLPRNAEVYVRPMFFATGGGAIPDPKTTEFILYVYLLPRRRRPMNASLSEFCRPLPESAPTDAKAPCLYPISQRAEAAAMKRGADSALLKDPYGNIAEFAWSNIFLVNDGVVVTPKWNGTFLTGITRKTVIALLRKDGFDVREATISPDILESTTEVFSTGNQDWVRGVSKVDDRLFDVGPVTRRAIELYEARAREFDIF